MTRQRLPATPPTSIRYGGTVRSLATEGRCKPALNRLDSRRSPGCYLMEQLCSARSVPISPFDLPSPPPMPSETSFTESPAPGSDRGDLWLLVEGAPSSRGPRTSGSKTTERAQEPTKRWPDLQRRLTDRAKRRSLDALWRDWGALDKPLCWGVAAAGGAVTAELLAVSRAATDKPLNTKTTRSVDLTAAAESLLDSLSRPRLSLIQIAETLPWAYAMPELSRQLDHPTWWELLGAMQTLEHASVEQANPASPLRLLGAGELGLVLSWRLNDLPSCASCGADAIGAVLDWLDAGAEAIDGALAEGGRFTRVLLASALRSRRLLKTGFKRTVRKSRLETITELATWAAAMTHSDGTTAFSPADRAAVREDTTSMGLMQIASTELDDEAIHTAVQAALGKSKSGGRLAWQVSLPEPALINDVAKVGVLLPEWDVRRGRIAIDFQSDPCRLQIHAGQPLMVDGAWQVTLLLDGKEQQPAAPWESVCEYSDDDVHYFELHQPWSGGLTLQRHLLVIRDDRCVMLADAVIRDEASAVDKTLKSKTTAGSKPSIEYIARLPIDPGLRQEPEADTREVIVADTKPRAICMPLALPEWRVGPTPGTFEVAADGALVTRIKRNGSLFAPLWLDFHRRRFTRPRTWRQLTIAEDLRIVDPSEAVAFRVQVGSEQWIVYRSLTNRVARTMLGQHLVADFYCGRFDPSDGSVEELVKVDTV